MHRTCFVSRTRKARPGTDIIRHSWVITLKEHSIEGGWAGPRGRPGDMAKPDQPTRQLGCTEAERQRRGQPTVVHRRRPETLN